MEDFQTSSEAADFLSQVGSSFPEQLLKVSRWVELKTQGASKTWEGMVLLKHSLRKVSSTWFLFL